MKKDNLFYSLIYFITACVFLNMVIFCPPKVGSTWFEYCLIITIIAAWFIGGAFMLLYFYKDNKRKRIGLVLVPYSIAEGLLEKGWTLAKEEDNNYNMGLVYLELLEEKRGTI
jgi:hypothetical protein